MVFGRNVTSKVHNIEGDETGIWRYKIVSSELLVVLFPEEVHQNN